MIRQELAAGAESTIGGERRPSGGAVRRAILVNTSSAYLTIDEVVEETGAREELIRELEDFGVVQPEQRDGQAPSTTRPTARSSAPPTSSPASASRARNLRVFRSSADREANLLEALLGPSLRSRNPQRRKEALESLENLAATVSHLKHLLLVRDLRRLARRVAAPRPWPRVTPPADDRGAAIGGLVAGLRSLQPAALVAADERGSRTSSDARRASAAVDQGAGDDEGRGVRADYRCTELDRGGALRLGAADSPGPRSSGTCAARRSRSSSSPATAAPR